MFRVSSLIKTLIFTLLLPATSWSVVDMKNANFADTWTDLIAPGTGYDLRVRRTYNSRSLFNGMFGFGWCSEFETALDTTSEGNVKLTECGGGLEIVYTPRNFSPGEIEKTIQKIVKKHKASRPGLSAKFIKGFKTKLRTNGNLRSYYADLYGIKAKVKEGTTFYANGREVERISLKNNVYTRFLSDNTIQRFNKKGQMIYMSDRNNNNLKFKYAGGFLKQIVDNNGRTLNFKFYQDNRKVKEITGPNGLKVEYKFLKDDLGWVKNAWNNSYTYRYDDLHNLTRIGYPDKTFKVLTYDKNKDWVTSFQSRNKCIETYKYLPQSDDPKNHYISKVTKKCGKEVTVQASYEFWHKTRKDGQKYLARVKTIRGTEVTDITYHPVFGRPIRSCRGTKCTKNQYFDNGLIKMKEIGRQRTIYEYKNKFRKVSKIFRTTYNKKGRAISKESTDFRYDKKANLTFAKNSRGQKVKLTYDKQGRIRTIEDHAKKLVKIKYENRFGKPAYVQRPGVGAITIAYKSDGSIKKVTSDQGPVVASQIASTFNNLLDIIAPATEELAL